MIAHIEGWDISKVYDLYLDTEIKLGLVALARRRRLGVVAIG